MMQLVLHAYPSANAKYQLISRRKPLDLASLSRQIETEIDHLCSIRFHAKELDYLAKLPYFKQDFIDFLQDFQLKRSYIEVKYQPEFSIVIKGPWLQTILFEVPLLAIITGSYYAIKYPTPDYQTGRERLVEKIHLIKRDSDMKGLRFSDFGTRRRFSFDWQQEVVATLQAEMPEQFLGTSNVNFAKKFNLPAIGTMAHEFIQAFQVIGPNIRDAQRSAFEAWLREYRGQLAIALSDTINLTTFLKDFDGYLAKVYDGARQDSGDPFTWAQSLINHYQQLGICPKDKTLVFSDSVTMSKAIELYQQFKNKVNLHFGMGTHLTNDLGYEHLDIVIKLVEFNGLPVAKITDNPNKTTSPDRIYLAYLKKVFNLDT